MTTLETPVEIDTKLAELNGEMAKLEQVCANKTHTVLSAAGATFYYRGRQRVTDMTKDEAIDILSASPEYRNLSYGKTNAELLEQLSAAQVACAEKLGEIHEIRKLYRGWSRFFVVTSSAGHIHSSTACQTCRPTTQFGWLPYLSGKGQAEAIKSFGPAAETLCSVCFPDAPVANRNLTNAERAALLKGETPKAKTPEVYCSGSGKPSATPVNFQRMYKAATCPDCGAVGAATGTGLVRKHKAVK